MTLLCTGGRMTHVPSPQGWSPGLCSITVRLSCPGHLCRVPAGSSSPRGPGFPHISLPVVEGGTAVEVKVKGVVDKVLGHSMAFRMMVPLSPQMAIKQAPSPSVVL